MSERSIPPFPQWLHLDPVTANCSLISTVNQLSSLPTFSCTNFQKGVGSSLSLVTRVFTADGMKMLFLALLPIFMCFNWLTNVSRFFIIASQVTSCSLHVKRDTIVHLYHQVFCFILNCFIHILYYSLQTGNIKGRGFCCTFERIIMFYCLVKADFSIKVRGFRIFL